MRDSVLLCISTLLESSNHYSRMFTLTTPNGTPLFETMQISLVCDACLASDHPERCTHRAAEMPRWLSSSKMETIKTLLADDPALLMRESMGISAETTTRAFPEPHVAAFLERPHTMPSRLAYVYTSVDPAGGGSSNFAIASVGMMSDGRVILLGLEALRTREASAQHKLLIEHMTKLRGSSKELKSVMFVLGLESNLGFEAQHIIHTLRVNKFHNWISLQEGVDGTPGILTTNSSKEVMCVAMQELLSHNRLVVGTRFMSISYSPKEILDQLAAEMRSFMVFVDAPKTLFGKPRRTFTGKLGGHNDDVVIALQLAVLTMQIFTRSDKYARFN